MLLVDEDTKDGIWRIPHRQLTIQIFKAKKTNLRTAFYRAVDDTKRRTEKRNKSTSRRSLCQETGPCTYPHKHHSWPGAPHVFRLQPPCRRQRQK
jgi:hypothetical protein